MGGFRAQSLDKDIPDAYRGREIALQPEPSVLTPLGRKLLGLDSWNEA